MNGQLLFAMLLCGAVSVVSRRLRWIFQEITDKAFHWTGETRLPDGSWRLEAEFFGRRR